MSAMFAKLGQAAEKVANGVSRRRFFARMAKWATGAAVGIAGLSTAGNAAVPLGQTRCCYYGSSEPVIVIQGTKCINANNACPTSTRFNGRSWPLLRQGVASFCYECSTTFRKKCCYYQTANGDVCDAKCVPADKPCPTSYKRKGTVCFLNSIPQNLVPRCQWCV